MGGPTGGAGGTAPGQRVAVGGCRAAARLWGFLIKVGLVVPLMKVQAGGLLRSATLMALGEGEGRAEGGRGWPSQLPAQQGRARPRTTDSSERHASDRRLRHNDEVFQPERTDSPGYLLILLFLFSVECGAAQYDKTLRTCSSPTPTNSENCPKILPVYFVVMLTKIVIVKISTELISPTEQLSIIAYILL